MSPKETPKETADPEKTADLWARHVGFTGSRNGMTLYQTLTVTRLLQPYDWIHHGDCVGGDAQCHDIARLLGKKVETHPPIILRLRANRTGDRTNPPKGYIQRDHDLVDASACLIAAPDGIAEEHRSGTWATARYARKQGKPVTLVLRDGSCVSWGIAQHSPKEAV